YGGFGAPSAAAVPEDADAGGGEDVRWALRASSSCTSSSSCSRNWCAMERARPTQRPTSETTRGSFSGPSTISARTKMIRISKNRPSNRSGAPLALRVALLRDLREFGVRALGADLLRRGVLLLLALAHRLLEAAQGVAQVRAHGTQLLRAEYDEHDQEKNHQLAHSNAHNSRLHSPRRRARAKGNDRSNTSLRPHKFRDIPGHTSRSRSPQVSSQNVTGPSLTSATCMSA